MKSAPKCSLFETCLKVKAWVIDKDLLVFVNITDYDKFITSESIKIEIKPDEKIKH